jgi:ribonuclease I
VQASALGGLLAAGVGREVSRRKLIEAFETSFGPDAGKALTLLCAQQRLIELRITLQPSAIDGALGADDLRPTAGGTRGSCPATILIDANGP